MVCFTVSRMSQKTWKESWVLSFEFCSWSLYVPMVCFTVSRMSQKTWKESSSISSLLSPFYYLRAWPCSPLGVSSLGAFWGSMRACKGNYSINTPGQGQVGHSRSSGHVQLTELPISVEVQISGWSGNVTLCDRFALMTLQISGPCCDSDFYRQRKQNPACFR